MSGLFGQAGGVQTVIDIDKAEIKAGNGFASFYAKTLTLASPGDKLYMRWHVGATKFFNFNYCVFNEQDVEVRMFKDGTVSGAGTELTPSNLNLNSSNLPEHQVYFDAAYSDFGTPIIPSVGSVSNNGLHLTPGITKIITTEFIGEKNTEYLAQIFNRSGGANDVSFTLFGYESS